MDLREYFKHTIIDNKYIPHEPSPKQFEAIMRLDRELFYGGAGGGGKSDWLLMTALQFVDVPGYAALIVMDTVSNLGKPEALLDRAHDWLYGTDAIWHDKKKMYKFPSGARVDFGYMQYENDKYQYKSAAYQTICFDEVTMFTETQYSYLFTRNRKSLEMPVPLRVRSAANPDGPGVIWVKRRFVDQKPGKKNIFIPAKLQDNPFIDQEEYMESLSLTDPLTRRRIRDGEWILGSGEVFKRPWFKIFDRPINSGGTTIRYWDLAATEKNTENNPDYAVGGKFCLEPDRKTFIYCDRMKLRASPAKVMDAIIETAKIDGPLVPILIEQDPGAAGKLTIEGVRNRFEMSEMYGYSIIGSPVVNNKVVRATPVANHAYGTDGTDGNVYLFPGAWNEDFLDHAEAFPSEKKDDDVDVLSGAYNWLMKNTTVGEVISGTVDPIPDPMMMFN